MNREEILRRIRELESDKISITGCLKASDNGDAKIVYTSAVRYLDKKIATMFYMLDNLGNMKE